MNKRVLSFFVCVVSLAVAPSLASDHKTLPKEKIGVLLKNYVLQNKAKNVSYPTQPYMESFRVDDANRRLTLKVSPSFATQDFTEQSVKYYYKRLSKSLPKPYNRYDLSIECIGMPIEQLVAGAKSEAAGSNAFWGQIDYEGQPWVLNESQPFFVSHGLFDRHISLWASHGIYYDQKKGRWKWQRQTCSAPQRICSPRLLSCLTSFLCLRMRVLLSTRHVSATGRRTR